MMGTEIFKIDASWAEKLTKTRVSFLMTPTVYGMVDAMYLKFASFCLTFELNRNSWLLEDNWERRMG